MSQGVAGAEKDKGYWMISNTVFPGKNWFEEKGILHSLIITREGLISSLSILIGLGGGIS